eukprot:TRINITY_DN13085_c0_g1_i1.p1 TRINITY_DN13085_c0_g1~~TRINITY_DN13085_c0_g1_i1.p1  ORF type:complete len:203 (-),score=32.43 TRINITY_DN13085_c0_g1_i1:126-734(-)
MGYKRSRVNIDDLPPLLTVDPDELKTFTKDQLMCYIESKGVTPASTKPKMKAQLRHILSKLKKNPNAIFTDSNFKDMYNTQPQSSTAPVGFHSTPTMYNYNIHLNYNNLRTTSTLRNNTIHIKKKKIENYKSKTLNSCIEGIQSSLPIFKKRYKSNINRIQYILENVNAENDEIQYFTNLKQNDLTRIERIKSLQKRLEKLC